MKDYVDIILKIEATPIRLRLPIRDTNTSGVSETFTLPDDKVLIGTIRIHPCSSNTPSWSRTGSSVMRIWWDANG